MDTLVAAGAGAATASSPCGSQASYGWWWCLPSFGAPEVTKERVSWTAPTLYPGTYTLTYAALAVTTGPCGPPLG